MLALMLVSEPGMLWVSSACYAMGFEGQCCCHACNRESNLFWLVITYQDILQASSIARFTFEKGKENYSLFLKFILSL